MTEFPDKTFDEPDIQRQWEEWKASDPLANTNAVSNEEMKRLLLKDIELSSSMSSQEYMLWKKWVALKLKYPAKEVSTLFGKELQIDPSLRATLDNIKSNIWTFDDPMEYANLRPKLVFAGNNAIRRVTGLDGNEIVVRESGNEVTNQKLLTLFVSSGERGHGNVGRNMFYVVVDEVAGKYLGVITISSDYLDLTCRDQYIGWEKRDKTLNKIKHTAVCSVIVPTQPFGYNFVGGKLLSLLCLSNRIQNDWQELYGDRLVGITTTSFYGKSKAGGMSQYDRLKHWKKMGYTSGAVVFEPNKNLLPTFLEWFKVNHPLRYFELYVATTEKGPYERDNRNRSYKYAYSRLGIPGRVYTGNHERGVYFSELYTNTLPFLRGEIEESELIPAFDFSPDYLIDVWRNKYAAKRVENLIANDRISKDGLFYDDLLYLSWEDTRKKYLGDIGR